MEKLFSVRNKTALITGAASGIGRYSATTLAKHGANIILVDKNEQGLKDVEQQCNKYGSKTITITADIRQKQSIDTIIALSKEEFKKVDILLNAAGISLKAAVLEVSEEQWNNVIDTNLKGTFLLCQAIARWMIDSKTAGKLINISSAASFYVSPLRPVYSASKISIESITRSFALSLVSHDIQVNCIAPGFVITELTRDYLLTEAGIAELKGVPMQRAANVNELEGILLLLASNASSYMTGSIIRVDGGFSINKV